MIFYKHDFSIIDENVNVGEKTKIWAFSHISNNVTIGKNCMIGEGVHIGPNVIIGNNVRIQNHSLIYEGVVIEDDVFIGPNATFTNDKLPRSKVYPERLLTTMIKTRGTAMAGLPLEMEIISIICMNVIKRKYMF